MREQATKIATIGCYFLKLKTKMKQHCSGIYKHVVKLLKKKKKARNSGWVACGGEWVSQGGHSESGERDSWPGCGARGAGFLLTGENSCFPEIKTIW